MKWTFFYIIYFECTFRISIFENIHGVFANAEKQWRIRWSKYNSQTLLDNTNCNMIKKRNNINNLLPKEMQFEQKKFKKYILNYK